MSDPNHGLEEAKQLFVSMSAALEAAAELNAALLDTELRDHKLVQNLRLRLLAYDQSNALFEGTMQAMLVGWLGAHHGGAG